MTDALQAAHELSAPDGVGDFDTSYHDDWSPAELESPKPSTSDQGSLWEEVRRLLRIAGPLALQDVLLLLQDTISVAFVGHIDKTSLSCMTLATTMFNVLGLSLIMGIASGAETLSGQCFGAKNYRALGVTLQKSLLITWSACIVIVLGWTQLPKFLLATNQDPTIVAISMKLVWLRLPALFLLAAVECFKRYLMAQGIVTPTCLVYVVTTIMTPLINWIFIFGLGLGVEGASLANDTTCLLNVILLLVYMAYHHRQLKGTGRETWHGWSLDCLKKWGEYYCLAIPATVMLCLEWWTFETIILMTGILPHADTNLGVIGILFQIGGVSYMVPLGLQGAASTRVSNELGNGQPHVAKRSVRAAMSMGLCTQACIAGLIFTFRHQIPYALTSDPDIVAKASDILPILCGMMLCDGSNAVASGAIRGCGRQMTAACLNLGTFWSVGVPLAAILGFKTSMGVKGFWLGVAVSVWVQFGTMLTFITCLNWDKEALRAAALVQANKKLDDEESIDERTRLKFELDKD